jgi:predicted ATPase/class 3 adenylate cyclase
MPTGTVAFLFTDIEGSTQLLRSRPDAYRETLARHRRLIGEACSAGIRFGSAGDALFYAFASPAAAVAAAADAQRLLAMEPLKVRMGVSVGEVEVDGDDYVGLELHRVARICAAANGGQILASAEAISSAGPLGDGIVAVPLGSHVLRDFSDPQELFRLVIPGLPDVATAPRTEDARTVAVPRELSSLVGREEELRSVRELLGRYRLVTLTGTGGSGKTRLARRIAWNVAPLLRGSVVFVLMAPFERGEDVAAEIGRLLGERAATWEMIARRFAHEEGLLILDNAEHLPELGGVVERLLERCDRLTVLVTSRAPIGTAGEHVYTVEPLNADDAMTLLVDRARERGAKLPAGSETTRHLAHIASRLGGLPLAIELASARMRTLTPKGIAERLDRQLDLLTDTTRTGDARQQTIRNAIGWSYNLLAGRERRVFEALAVFAGPARLETIAHVAALEEYEALDALTALIDDSLVRLTSGSDEDARYTMLEPIRQYAAEVLTAHRNRTTAERRMLEWYAELVEGFESDTGYDVAGTEHLRFDMPNVWRAMTYATRHGLADLGIRVAFHTAHLSWSIEGSTPTLRYLAASHTSRPTTPRGRAMWAILESEHEAYPGSLPLALTARDLARASGSTAYMWLALRDLCWIACRHGQLEVAAEALAEGERLGRPAARWWALVSMTLSVLRGEAGRTDLARFAAELHGGRYTGEIDATDLCELAAIAVYADDGPRALAWARAAVSSAAGSGVPLTEQTGHLTACTAALMIPDAAAARRHAAMLLRLWHRVGDSPDCPRELTGHTVAGALALLRADDVAALVAGAVTPHIRTWCRSPDVHRLSPSTRRLDEARARSGEWAWLALTAEGATLDLDAALTRALETLAPDG